MLWGGMAQIFTSKAMTLPDRAYVKFQNPGVIIAIATGDRFYVNFRMC
jgi:hypothetical protein